MQTTFTRGIVYKTIAQLLLDSKNPRLPENASNMSQGQLLDVMEKDFDLLPIGRSLADNGFFIEEPLVVVKKEDEDKFIVIEGNRRLAALKLLTEAESREHSRFKQAWEELARNLKHPLTDIPVIEHPSRDDLIAILGFRHISGVRKWDARSKARYVHDLIEKRGPKADLGEIARELGSLPTVIRDNYVAYRAYLQASEEFGIDTSKIADFSVFYRAFGNANIQTYIGLNKKSEIPSKLRYPIPEKKSEQLKELIEIVHGTSDKTPIMSDSRQLSKIGKILINPEALKILRIGRNIDEAFAFTGGEELSLMENLSIASYNLEQALKYSYRFKGNEEVGKCVQRCAESLFEILKNFPEVRRRISQKR